MSKITKRNKEVSSAIAAANNIIDRKRKLVFSNALAAAKDVNNDPTEHSLPRNIGVSNNNKRVASPSKKTFSNINISSSGTRPSVTHNSTSDQVRVEECEGQSAPNPPNESIRSDARDPSMENVDKTFDATNDEVNGKRGRGLTRGLNTQKYTRKCGEKPKIIIPKGIDKPVGLHSSKHATQIGVLIRLEAPMQVEGWANITNEKKEDLFRKLINKLSYEVDEPHVVQCIWKSFSRQYSTFRSNARRYFQKMKAEGGLAFAKQNVYEKLSNRPNDWLWLCEFWETEKFKKISMIQSNNRKKMKHNHKLGTKSRAAHQYEHNLDDIDMYEAQYYNPKVGWANEEVEANYVEMKRLREEQENISEDAPRMSTEQICIQVLGENSMYAKSKGLPKKKSNNDSTFEINQVRLEEELASTQEELESAKAELALQKTIVEAVVKCVEKMTGKSFYEIISQPD